MVEAELESTEHGKSAESQDFHKETYCKIKILDIKTGQRHSAVLLCSLVFPEDV